VQIIAKYVDFFDVHAGYSSRSPPAGRQRRVSP